jgi:phosphopantothenoylcysteine decarboxylase/phosphopantothenate--cysteine ligase
LLPDPPHVKTLHVETATEMLAACRKSLPADIGVFAAAVSDWSAATVQKNKMKKSGNRNPPDIKLKENPDILSAISAPSPQRPKLVIGFAAETENLLDSARSKLKSKQCDWIVANDVSQQNSVFGSDENHVFLINHSETEEWQKASKQVIAQKLADKIADFFKDQKN